MTTQNYNRLFKIIAYVFILQGLYACGDSKARKVIRAGLEAHGGSAYENFVLEFDFRGRHYTAARNGGIFSYTREFSDSSGRVKDVLNNAGFTRYRNDVVVTLAPAKSDAFSRSVNSVIYFALLPFGLDDDAVIEEWVKETTIEGQPYDEVRVTFKRSGGGDDHQDEFLYWFHRDKHTMDYLAYSYETEGGGLRFRKAVNPRRAEGIRFQDYINYKPKYENAVLDEMRSMFGADSLEILSEINLENLTVRSYPAQD